MRVKKYVLDANIWISYFITQQELRLADIIFNNDLVIFYCDELLEELKRVLTYEHLKKYNIKWNKVDNFIQASAVHFSITSIGKYIPSDENDNYVIALALQTNSGFVTSGDTHILSQKEILEQKYKKLKIITKAEFEKKFHARPLF